VAIRGETGAGSFSRSPFLDRVGAVAEQAATNTADSVRPPSSADSVRPVVPAHYGSPLAEQRSLEARRAVVDLSDRAVLAVVGEDRLRWLDSLTSQSVAHLAPGESAETLLLDPNGHIEHAIRLVDDGHTTWLLVDHSQAGVLGAWLDRMRFTLHVEVSDRSDEYATVGVLGGGVDDAFSALAPFAAEHEGVPLVWHDPWFSPPAGGWQYALVAEHPSASWDYREVVVPRERFAELAALVYDGRLAAAGSIALDALRVAAWRPRQETEVDDRSIPHELDWLRSAVALDKGCYRGQETVAKVHNLGHPPRRLVLLHIDGSGAPIVRRGDEVVDSTPRDEGSLAHGVGHITSSAVHHELGPIALAVIKRGVPVDEQLAVVTADGPVAAAQETIVPPSAGAVAAIPRVPRLGVQKAR
jgi:folate-binding protein YgfZ